MDSNNRHKTRSCSLPSKLNPINQRIEDKLRKLRHKEERSTSASETISIGLLGLAELYQCINETLALPLTRHALSLRQHEKCVGELLRECSRLLIVCSTTREMMVQSREMAKRLEMSLSLCKESSTIQSDIASYDSSRKELIRRAKGVMLSLKQFNDDSLNSSTLFEEEDHRLSTAIKALICVGIINVSVYESLLSFLSKPVSKPKWSLLLRTVNKGREGKCNDKKKPQNELNDADAVIHTLLSKGTVNDIKSQKAQKRLKALMGIMERFEKSLQCLCKQLTETKVSLTDIVSF